MGAPDTPTMPPPAAAEPGLRPWPWKRSVLVVLVVGFAVAAGFGFRWWTHPHVFGDGGGGLGMGPVSLSQGTWTAGITYPYDGGDQTSLTFQDAPQPEVTTNTAGASIAFYICTPRAFADVAGAVHGRGTKVCSHMIPIKAGTTMRYPSRTQYIVAVLTPSKPGRFRVRSVSFDYSLGADHFFQRGTERLPVALFEIVK